MDLSEEQKVAATIAQYCPQLYNSYLEDYRNPKQKIIKEYKFKSRYFDDPQLYQSNHSEEQKLGYFILTKYGEELYNSFLEDYNNITKQEIVNYYKIKCNSSFHSPTPQYPNHKVEFNLN
jgi:hypothetical protein